MRVAVVELGKGGRALRLARWREALVACSRAKGGHVVDETGILSALLGAKGNGKAVSIKGGLFGADCRVRVIEIGRAVGDGIASSVGRGADGARGMVGVPGTGGPDVGL